MSQRVSLADLIAEVTTQIRQAAAESDGKDPVMKFQECEVEATMTVENQGGVGVKVWVAELGGRRKKSDSNTVRLRFTNLSHRPVYLPVVPGSPPGEHLPE